MSDVPRRLEAASVGRLVSRLRRSGPDLQPATDASLRSAPGWVAAYGLVKAQGTYWLWLEPRAGLETERGSGVVGARTDQLVLEVPPGRYLVDVLEATTGETLSRESAAGPPLVLGVPSRGAPLVAEIRPIGPARE